MTNVTVYNMQGASVGEMELNDVVFNREVHADLMHQAVVLYLASQRRGTQSAKTRAEVAGGGRKPWKQKGTGRARVGSSRNPVWRSGGVAFAPKPRSYTFTMPKKQRRIALASALSDKMQNGNLIVLDELNFDAPKTKDMLAVLGNFEATNALVVTGEVIENVEKSARNIVGICPIKAESVNVYNVLKYKKLILTKDAVAKLEEVLG